MTQGFGGELTVPDHSTLSRRARAVYLPATPTSPGGAVQLLVDSTGVKLCGPGEWLVEKHGTRRRRAWMKLHVGLDAATGRIVAATLTDHDVDDGSQVGAPLDQVEEPLACFVADGAYDQAGVTETVAAHTLDAAVVVPPRSTAVPSADTGTTPTQRDRHLQYIAEHGHLAWQKHARYNVRAWVEAFFSRWKRVIEFHAGRILPFNIEEARHAGLILDRARAHDPGFEDIAIAATAATHGLTILTAKERHFEPLGIAFASPLEQLPSVR